MKQNFMTGLLAIIMVIVAAGALFVVMTVYEGDKFDEDWLIYPTVIEKELKPLYGDEYNVDSTEY